MKSREFESNKTILCIEAYKNHRILYEQEFKFEGYYVLTAVDGKDALEKAQEHLPDIVVMDINIPKLDGLETMGRVLSKNKNIPIIINSAYTTYKDRFNSRATDAYMVKSSDLTELKNKINELLAR